MMLASMRQRWPMELRADFQQYYGLNLDGMGDAYSVTHAACLAVMLPGESRTMRAIDPACAWGLDQMLTAATANAARAIAWAMSGGKASDRPEPLLPPGRRDSDIEAIDADDYIAELARLRGGA